MRKTETIQVRIPEDLAEKMRIIKLQTGLTTSQVFRELLRVAQVKPVQIQVDLSVDEHGGK